MHAAQVRRQEDEALRSSWQMQFSQELEAQNAHHRRATSSYAAAASTRRSPKQKPSTSSADDRASSSSHSDSPSWSSSSPDRSRSSEDKIVVSEEDEEEGTEVPDAQFRSSHLTGFAALRTALSNFMRESPPTSNSPARRSQPTLRQVVRASIDQWFTSNLGVNAAFFCSGTFVLLMLFTLMRVRGRRRVRDTMGRIWGRIVETIRMGTQARYL